MTNQRYRTLQTVQFQIDNCLTDFTVLINGGFHDKQI